MMNHNVVHVVIYYIDFVSKHNLESMGGLMLHILQITYTFLGQISYS